MLSNENWMSSYIIQKSNCDFKYLAALLVLKKIIIQAQADYAVVERIFDYIIPTSMHWFDINSDDKNKMFRNQQHSFNS